MKNQIDYSRLFKENRRKARITQEHLARLIGVTRATIGAIEEGRAQPKCSIVVNAAIVFGHNTIDEFLELQPVTSMSAYAKLVKAYIVADPERRKCVEYILRINTPKS